ncbi:c-di-GMP-binding flagellar brake protein YcgR [Natranaerovirga pectinivora]|uniref:C-di-GMP-binding flagellar brake protein YcgR n=1 Tax=Natranaerovirga pectinivora TaxID=682400 RepID=A0A4R3MQ17_9FIRM|nr:flagellar brake domain-containing protein [Natranaerovirga pectinivora]TCT15082.1 c-di-GMP-binding flagellar brake protein YcgR [Natranaerovirga pectinivora]
MISKIVSLGDKIDITVVDKNKNHKNYISQVLEILDEKSLKVATPIEGGKIIPLTVGEEYSICFYSKNSLYKSKFKVKDRSKEDNQHFTLIELLTSLQKHQRRKFYRLNCVLMFQYKKEEKDATWHEGTINDLSGGGLRITSKEKLKVDDLIVCNLSLCSNNKEINLAVEGKVLTANDLYIEKDRKYEYRVQFENIDIEDQEQIIKFIFEEERRQRKKNKV